jgi:hypothetical protein
MQPHASPHPPLDGESDAAILAARGAQGGAGNQPPPSGIAHEGGQVRGLIGDITALHGKRQISAGPSLTCAPGDVRQPADGSPLWLPASSMRSRRAEQARARYWCNAAAPARLHGRRAGRPLSCGGRPRAGARIAMGRAVGLPESARLLWRRCARAVPIAGARRRLALCSAGGRHRDLRDQRKEGVRIRHRLRRQPHDAARECFPGKHWSGS